MPIELVKQLYVQNTKLLRLYSAVPISKSHLKATHNYCIALLRQAKQEPDLIFAQPQLYKTQLSYSENLSFNVVVQVCLLCVRNKVDEAITLQLMCAAFSLIALELENLKDCDSSNTPTPKIAKGNLVQKALLLKKNLSQSDLDLWLSTLTIGPLIQDQQTQKLENLNTLQSMTYIAIKLALLCTPSKQYQPLKFAAAFKKICLFSPQHWKAYLTPLIKYPSLSPPGTFVKTKDAKLFLIVAINTGNVTVISIAKKTSAHATPCTLENHKLPEYFASQPINQLSKLKLWWNEGIKTFYSTNSEIEQISAFESKLSIKSAPPSLLVIQDQLNNINTDISIIIKALEKEPSYIRHIRQTVNLANNQEQPIESVQHCLARLGYERTSHLLLEKSLLTRLNQEYFPLQQVLLNFCNVCAMIANELASHTKLIAPYAASTSIYFMLARIFTLTEVRKLNIHPASPNGLKKLVSLVDIIDIQNLTKSGLLIAHAWHHNQSILSNLQQCHDSDSRATEKPSKAIASLFGLSMLLAKEIYFSHGKEHQPTHKNKMQALKVLELNSQIAGDIAKNCALKSKLYSPIYS